MRKLGVIACCIAVLLGVLFGLRVLGSASTKAYLRAHATAHVMWVWSKDGRLVSAGSHDERFKIVMYRYPRLKDVPESFGFGQGFVQLQDVSGRVLAEKDAEDLAPLYWFRWSSNKVTVADFAEWDLPP